MVAHESELAQCTAQDPARKAKDEAKLIPRPRTICFSPSRLAALDLRPPSAVTTLARHFVMQ